MKKSILLSLIIAAAVDGSGLALLHAQSSSIEPVRWQRRGWEKAKERLGLTDDQIARIKVEMAAEKDALADLAHKVHAARIALRQTIQTPGATESEIRGAATTVGAAEGDLAIVRARLRAKIAPILTPEQLGRISSWQDRIDDRVDAAIGGLIGRLAG